MSNDPFLLRVFLIGQCLVSVFREYFGYYQYYYDHLSYRSYYYFNLYFIDSTIPIVATAMTNSFVDFMNLYHFDP